MTQAKGTLTAYGQECISFLSWLVDVCEESWNRFTSFQRKQTALHLYDRILENLCNAHSASRTKNTLLLQDLKIVLQVNTAFCIM